MPHNCYLYHLQWKRILKQHYRCHKGTCIISFPSFFPGFRGDSTTNRPLRLLMTQQTAKNAHEFVSQLFTIIFCCLEGISFSREKSIFIIGPPFISRRDVRAESATSAHLHGRTTTQPQLPPSKKRKIRWRTAD